MVFKDIEIAEYRTDNNKSRPKKTSNFQSVAQHILNRTGNEKSCFELFACTVQKLPEIREEMEWFVTHEENTSYLFLF